MDLKFHVCRSEGPALFSSVIGIGILNLGLECFCGQPVKRVGNFHLACFKEADIIVLQKI